MNIIVIGGQGFIGHNLVIRLAKEGHNVKVFGKNLHNSRRVPGCTYVFGDFTKIEQYKDLFENIDIVYHLISTTLPKSSNENIEYDIQSNVVSTIKLLKICTDYNIKKIIYTSSAGTIYGAPQYLPINEEHPTTPICSYGITKLMIEKYLHMYYELYGLEYQILRISNPYGPYQNPFSQQGAIGVFLGKILRNKDIEIWGDGCTRRDYIYISDLIEVLYASSQIDIKNKILNVGSGKGTSLNELVEIIKEIVGNEFKVIYKNARNIDVPINVLDITMVREHLAWEPKVGLHEGIEQTWIWMKKCIK